MQEASELPNLQYLEKINPVLQEKAKYQAK
jgi:hypothetical protein